MKTRSIIDDIIFRLVMMRMRWSARLRLMGNGNNPWEAGVHDCSLSLIEVSLRSSLKKDRRLVGSLIRSEIAAYKFRRAHHKY